MAAVGPAEDPQHVEDAGAADGVQQAVFAHRGIEAPVWHGPRAPVRACGAGAERARGGAGKADRITIV
ncbi:hypothetical protein Sm713_36560 [Streptomyces sp. TS71-3]|nr:hypothetical protein Sm713_36560 [Streptomyces sp. TS71-3]